MNSSLSPSSSLQNFGSEPESIIIQKQRKELQLLIAELKDRDKELNEMVAVHQRQLVAWEEDRQKILTLAERCNRTESELLKRNEMITTLTNRLKLLERHESDWKRVLENTQRELQEVSQTASESSLYCRTLEEKNQALNGSVVELSNKVGQLQAGEQELVTILRLKDREILEATNVITEFKCKFKMLESALRAARIEESRINKEKLKELMLESSKLKDDLSEKTKENNEQREELIRLKQENNYLSNKLMFSVERANRKDHLLQSAKSKQLRTNTELSSLRQIYLKQQQDLEFLHFNLEKSQEKRLNPKDAHEASIEMVLSDLKNSGGREAVCSKTTQRTHTRFLHFPQCSSQHAGCLSEAESRQQVPASDSEERLFANLDALEEGTCGCSEALPREEQARGSPSSRGRIENRPASEADGTWMMDGREFARTSEQNPVTSLPIHKGWLRLDPSTEPANTCSPTSKRSSKFDGSCKAVGAVPAGIPRGPSPQKSPCLVRAVDPNRRCCCCSMNNVLPDELLTDQEWMQIFKPVKSGDTRHRALCSSPQATRIKSTTEESSHNTDMTLSDLGPPCLTSTQKSSGPKRHEKLFESDRSPKLASVPEVEAVNGCCHSPVHHDSCSPTSKLQRLLTDSRQMLADLDRSYLQHIAHSCSPQDGSTPVAEERPGRPPAAEETETKLCLFSL